MYINFYINEEIILQIISCSKNRGARSIITILCYNQ